MNYKKRYQRAEQHAKLVKQRQELKELYHSNDLEKKKPSSSKLFLGFVLGDFLLIQFFCMYFMYAYPEYSDLGSFIGIAVAIIGQVGVILGYFKKSTAENTVGGIVYETTIQNQTADEDAVG